jgi:hypothetical protein
MTKPRVLALDRRTPFPGVEITVDVLPPSCWLKSMVQAATPNRPFPAPAAAAAN